MTIESNENEAVIRLEKGKSNNISLKTNQKCEEQEIATPLKKKEAETETDPLWLKKKSFRFTLMAIFTALTVVLGFLLVYLPNIQLVFVMLFLSGFIMGKKDGAVIGFMSSFLFCFFNPLGASPLPLLAIQISYYGSIAIIGAFTRSFLENKSYFQPKNDLFKTKILILFGVLGGSITFIFDILTTLLHALVFFGTLEAFWPTYLFGISFTTVHLIANILLFIFVLPALIQTIYKMLDL
ncbi:MAG: ECF transporter S component [Promethearchaeia archaeon]